MTAEPDVRAAVGVVRRRIAQACVRAGRDPSEVTLVAATKTVAPERVMAARDAGIRDFGESYAKELAMKAQRIEARWHYIGTLQAGTAAKVADLADVVHSAEPGRALERIAGRAERAGRAIDCLVEVDFTGRRHGLPSDLDAIVAFLRQVGRWPALRFVGLMTIPPQTPHPEGARPFFVRLRDIRERLRATFSDLRELSMGMSGDYPVAVEEGATMVRVGTALFGERPMRVARGGTERPLDDGRT